MTYFLTIKVFLLFPFLVPSSAISCKSAALFSFTFVHRGRFVKLQFVSSAAFDEVMFT